MHGREVRFPGLKDKFGLSWQIAPRSKENQGNAQRGLNPPCSRDPLFTAALKGGAMKKRDRRPFFTCESQASLETPQGRGTTYRWSALMKHTSSIAVCEEHDNLTVPAWIKAESPLQKQNAVG